MAKAKKPRLGRGLSSLMSMPVAVTPPPVGVGVLGGDGAAMRPSDERMLLDGGATGAVSSVQDAGSAAREDAAGGLIYLEIASVQPNPHQPRQAFDPVGLERLAESIRQDGLMQPIVVRPHPKNAGDGPVGVLYEIVAGERRWRAAQLAKLTQLPALVRDLSDRQMAEWALIENLQREDLNAIERAEAFRGLIDQFGLSHEQVADRVGVERPTISNSIRLLELQEDIQQLVRHSQLSAGHARALLGLTDPVSQQAMARRAVAGGWSVRMVEAAVKRVTSVPVAEAGSAASVKSQRSVHIADLEQQIAAQLKTKVHIKSGRRKGSGTLSIDFFNLDQFDELLGKLGVRLD